MRGFAAELSGARDWMKVATAGEGGIRLYTCISKSISKTTSKCLAMRISILIICISRIVRIRTSFAISVMRNVKWMQNQSEYLEEVKENIGRPAEDEN